MSGQLGHRGLLLASGPAWTPAQIGTATLKYWMNDDTVASDAGAGACSNWSSPGGYFGDAFGQTTGARRPLIVAAGLNGRRIIRFNGTSSELVTSAGGGATALFRDVPQAWMCVVCKSNISDTTDRTLIGGPTATGAGRLSMILQRSTLAAGLGGVNARRLDADAVALLNNTSNPGTAAHMRMLTMDWSQGDVTSYINGVADAQNLSFTTSGNTSNTAADRPLGLGAYPGFAGAAGAQFASVDIAEVLIGTTLLTLTERLKLEGYLAHRWGLTGSLDSGHPYKTVAPTV